MRLLENADVSGKRVLLRLSADVPLTADGQSVADDRRLRAALPTIQFLLGREAKIILLAHLGDPDGRPDQAHSLRPVYLRLSALLKKPINFAPQLFSASTKTAVTELEQGQLLGLENLRFDPGEEANSRTFARNLAEYGEIYVNDAFSVSHRLHASIVAITEFLPSFAGLLLEKEYHLLTSLLHHPASPFVAVVGGAKVRDKLPVIEQLIQKADRVLVGGEIANTFLAAAGQEVGDSRVEKELFGVAKEILNRGKGKVILPIDFVRDSAARILDIGPETIVQFSRYLTGAKTIFWNGNLGKSEESAYRHGSDSIAQLVASSGATTIVGGGNTTGILDRLELYDEITFVSSGGGATLELLGGRHLPGIAALGE